MAIAQSLKRLAFQLHYRQCRLVNRLLPTIDLDGVRLHIAPSVYKPLENEHKVAQWITEGKRVLDIGCGSGVIAVFAAFKSQQVTAIDINPEAISNTLLNCRNLGLSNVTAFVSDMFAAVQGETFDYILCYPPLYQLPSADPTEQWATSTKFVNELFRGAADHLSEGGKLLVLLPDWYRPSPDELAPQFGLRVVGRHPHPDRSFGIKLHSIPYFHISMKHTVFEIERA